MTGITQNMREFATRILDFERREDPSATAKGSLDGLERLRPHLVLLMGNGGVRALISRALVLAGEEVPWLGTVRVEMEGALEGLEELCEQLGAEKFFEGQAVLIAQVLGLLVAFIGERLAWHLVREAWPEVSLEGLDQGLDLAEGG